MARTDIKSLFEKNSDRISKLCRFLRKNSKIKNHIYSIFNIIPLHSTESAKERIRLIYISAIEASGGRNLKLSGKSCKAFKEMLDKLPNTPQIKLQTFFEAFRFSRPITSFKDLFEFIVQEKSLCNIRGKKAAIFLRNLNWVQENTKPKIFKNHNIKQNDLMIPIDALIIFILNKFLKLGRNKLDQYKDFNSLNEEFKSLLKDRFMIIEDLWFWGYFSNVVSHGNRKLKFNTDKFYTSPFLIPNEKNKKLIEKFISFVKEE
jgi:hypothetical protein